LFFKIKLTVGMFQKSFYTLCCWKRGSHKKSTDSEICAGAFFIGYRGYPYATFFRRRQP